MYRTIIMALALSACILSETPVQTKDDFSVDKKADNITITITKLDVTDTNLELNYKIKNGSKHDIWICDSVTGVYGGPDFEVFLTEDTKTFVIRRRLDVPTEGVFWHSHPCGRYVRLCAGQTRVESLSLTVPVQANTVFLDERREQGSEYGGCLALEIGYYTRDLPGIIRGILEEAEKSPEIRTFADPVYLTAIKEWFGGVLDFNELNEELRYRDEEVLIPYTHQALKGEQVLRVIVDDLHIPYEEKEDRSGLSPPDLSRCSRLEIRYQPSMFEYFLPYASQQNLLDATETKYLKSQKMVVVDDREDLKAFAYEINKGLGGGGIFAVRSTAHMVCYRDNEPIISFTVHDKVIETEEKQRFRYRRGLPNIMRKLTPQIQPFELRVQCAANLKDLWHRLRLYHKAERNRLKDSSSKSEIVYPAPAKWCDAMVQAYQRIGMVDKFIMRPHMCLGAGEGKNHYAMNPNCKPDSPLDMVLLFETKAGWNQHGGAELFTFDNHDPKGGCVLLNDGTVKFIRTKEELRQLRWK